MPGDKRSLKTPLIGDTTDDNLEQSPQHHEIHYEPSSVHDQSAHHHHYDDPVDGENKQRESGEADSEHQTPKNVANESPGTFVYLGFAFAVLAGCCFTSGNVLVKFVPEISSWHLLFVRCVVQLVIMIPIMIYKKVHPLGTPDWSTRWRVLAQGVLGGLLLLAMFKAVSCLPLGDATAIFFSSPAFTMVLSMVILKDHCGFFRFIIATVLLGGVVILSRPPSLFPSPPNSPHTTANNSSSHDNLYQGNYSMIGLSSAIAVPILSAFIVIITRQVKHVHYSVLVFWFGIGGLVMSLVGIYSLDSGTGFFYNWSLHEWMLSVLLAMVGIIGSVLMTKAIFWVTPSKVMVIRSFEVVVAYILQLTVFDTPTYVADIGGTILIVLAVLGMGLEDFVMQSINFRFM